MCNEEIRWQELAEQLQMSVEQIQAMTAYSEERMQRFAEDGLSLRREGIVMREKGSPYSAL